MIPLTYSWDFETLVQSPTRVWAWSQVNVFNYSDVTTGNNMESFIQEISRHSCKGFFHNLKFDGDFLISYLLKNGYEHVLSTKKMKPKTFNILMSDIGQLYRITICFHKGVIVQINDSLKLLPFKVEKIAKDFDLELDGKKIRKLEIDYKAFRPVGHALTDEEKEYVIYDTLIMAMALNYMLKRGMSKLTIGSNALYNYKTTLKNKSDFQQLFPLVTPAQDAFIRKAYKGGFVYCAPKYKGKIVKEGIVLDVNSLYPSQMRDHNNPYPVGKPVYFKGEYKDDPEMPLYVQHLFAEFEVKKCYLPTIQVKNNFSSFSPTDYLESSRGELVELTLTSVDLKLFFDHYNVITYRPIDGMKFHQKIGLFDDYIDHWNQEKMDAAKDHNPSKRALAKLMNNNLYGKFGTNTDGTGKYPVLEDGIVHYKRGARTTRNPVYIPVACFVTAYARNVTIRSAQAVYNRFAYADTDSLHLVGLHEPDGLWVDPYELGAWKHESTFVKAKFLRAKTYIEYGCDGTEIKEDELELKVTCAGMPKACHSQVTFKNFKVGAVYKGKLIPKHVDGGIVLEDTTFKIT